ncbi:ATP phosphoribosyltransferase [Kyrpidia tusciae]|uniref:ATP phosphoribosyltransferase n=1 Tax=Kyrpidia tusciae (strain DSM 2912 / NBRC 15312 / T2) TaxID=562970 RepID=D5WRC1_KYRT2|nr:ATP phosphoribosyltransferase [Kyrpidia tusciae]ADG06851.1 ATP phosphoribosyltransferase [Kyrpidia tusciae DSM 2912]MBE3552236.1 ATP phosphoribosyltransferase [Kyrpidia tusciae]
MMEPLTIALSKGRILPQTVALFRRAGLEVPEDLDESRKLILPSADGRLRFILAKPVDVPTYVEYGAADLGVVGKDVLLEARRNLYELLDLGIGRCRMCLCGLPDLVWRTHRVASKYPHIAADYFRDQGKQVEVVYLNGSVELAPLVGLADAIVDLVETGRTLKENGLVIHEVIAPITTRMVANRMSFRLKGEAIDRVTQALQRVVGGGDSC